VADNKKFVADVSKWVDLNREDLRVVFLKSFENVLSDANTPVGAGGLMPVDVGTLRNSLTVELNGKKVSEGADVASLTLSGYELGQPASAEWAVAYATRRHYLPDGLRGGGLWRDVAAAKWSTIVAANADKLRARRA
jgi:hypothetical protein